MKDPAAGTCPVPATPTPLTAASTAPPTATPTLRLPDIPPPGATPALSRPVFSTVNMTSNVTYGSAVNGSAQTVTLQLDIYEPSGDTVTQRPAIVWCTAARSAVAARPRRDRGRSEHFARQGYFNVSINYRPRARRLYRERAGRCVARDPGSARRRQDGRSLPAHERRAVRHRRHAHRDRRFVGRRDHRAECRLHLQRRSAGGGGRGGSRSPARRFSPAARSVPATHRVCCSTARPTRWSRTSWASTMERRERRGTHPSSRPGSRAGHVPYAAHRTEILDQTTNFLLGARPGDRSAVTLDGVSRGLQAYEDNPDVERPVE